MRNAKPWPTALLLVAAVAAVAVVAVVAVAAVAGGGAADARARPDLASATPQPATPPWPAACAEGTLVTVVAHLDDDLLFVNPGISERLKAGWCIVTVHLIGGAEQSPFDYVLTRERAVRQAYARMAGVRNAWTESTVTIAGKPVHRMTLDAASRVTLLELRLPGGHVRGGRVPLGLLWDEGATIASYPMNADGSGKTRYERVSLTATLAAILAHATLVYTLNPDTVPFLEHPDHIYAARITRHAAQAAGPRLPIRYHLTYVTAGMQANLPAEATQAKRDEVASYFAIDGGDIGQVFGEYEWNGNWVARRYAFEGGSGQRGDQPATRLVNVRSRRCLSAGSAGPQPRTCDGGRAQLWHWRPVPSYPGSLRGAALVSAASARCVAERAGRLVEEACDAEELAQRFTPWDFGVVLTPLGHCLGEANGALALAACGPLTTAYRWSTTPAMPWTDPRAAGALYGDVTGAGRPSAVYVRRRTDGPGFDVWVAALTPGVPAARWYSNVVPFDSRASVPSCGGDALCFDTTRFLLADFEGTGRAALMAVGPAGDGGTALWLFPNRGNAFGAPRLWQRNALAPAHTQQLVAGDYDGDGRADIMAAQRARADAGLDLWVLTSRGTTAHAPVLWRSAAPLAAATQFFTVRRDRARQAGLVAVEYVDGTLAFSQLPSTGRGFDLHRRIARFAASPAALPRITAGPLDATGTDGLVLLGLRERGHGNRGDRADIDVWTIAGSRQLGKPVHAGTIDAVAWADALPALVAMPSAAGGTRAALVLFHRTDAPLDAYHFIGGAPALATATLAAGGSSLGPLEQWGTLPGRYTETLRLDRQQ